MIWSALKQKGVLGINSRNLLYINPNNKRRFFPNVDNKLTTKKLAIKNQIGVPELYGVVEYPSQARKVQEVLEDQNSFVIKPCRGSCGEGILVVKETRQNFYVLSSGDAITKNEIIYHLRNTLAGVYSLGSSPDVAIIEALVVQHDSFSEYSFKGVPDVRIIVYKGKAAMAMLRLPTRESGGKANLHQGAVGVGVSLLDGSFKGAVCKDKPITHHPDTGADLSEIVVPRWEDFLLFAIKASKMCNLGYVGVDMVLDQTRGPLLLEVNARPGLSVQIANQEGLEGRLRQIDSETAEASD